MWNPAPITVDDSHWPLVLVRVVGTPSVVDLQRHLEQQAGLLRRGPHLQLVDAKSIGMLSAEARQRLVEWLPPHEELIRERLLGTAYVTDSTFLRLTLSLLFHVRPLTYPHIIVSHMERAAEWAADRMDDTGRHEAAEHIRHHFGLLLEWRSSQAG